MKPNPLSRRIFLIRPVMTKRRDGYLDELGSTGLQRSTGSRPHPASTPARRRRSEVSAYVPSNMQVAVMNAMSFIAATSIQA